jgi:hypothetical protein
VERVLANIDASYGDCGVEFRRHSVLLVFGAPCQRNLLAGQEHGRTIPLAVISRIEIPQCSSLLPHQGMLSFRTELPTAPDSMHDLWLANGDNETA